MKIKVKFISNKKNPEYGPDNQNVPGWIPYEGTGDVLQFIKLNSYGVVGCVVKTNDNRLHCFQLSDLEVIE